MVDPSCCCSALWLFPGGNTIFLVVRTKAEQGVFGVDPVTLEMTDDRGFMVPTILAEMRKFLEEQNAWAQVNLPT